MTDRATRLDRLEAFLRRTWLLRRVLFWGSTVFPGFVTLLLAFLALYPMLFAPGEKLVGILASLVGGGLSFAAVSFAAAASRGGEGRWALRMTTAGSMLLRFAIAMAVALALAAARARVVADFAGAAGLDYVLRGLLVLITAGAIGSAFFGFQILVMLFGPALEEEEIERLRRLDETEQATRK